MGRYRNYSDEDKATALAFLAANRNNYKAASKHTGIPWQTLQSWHRDNIGVNEAVTEILPEKTKNLADALEEKLWLVVNLGFGEDKIKDAYLSNVTTALGTLVDKIRLLREQPTAIIGDDGKPKQINIAYTDREPDRTTDAVPAPTAPDAEAVD